jgi:Tfp pilus assembly protein FimT
LLGIAALLMVFALPAVSQELHLVLEQSALEKLSAKEGALYIEWGVYRNT